MSTVSRGRATALLALIALILTACTPDDAETNSTQPDGAEFSFGSPAESAIADRVIEITTTDNLVFEPAELSVIPGETVTFRLINEGQLVHDFTLGDEEAQDEHEAEMAEMSGMTHEEPNVVTIPAGGIAELTWRFGEDGTVLIGCHQPGHYDAGMTGRITIEE